MNGRAFMGNTCLITVAVTLLLSIRVCAQNIAQKNIGDLHVIPVGLDAYRMWEKWPMQRIGARTYMRSTYDRE
ncbi:MAG TPA: hypothetical protein VK541_24945, partial [Pedobacter sp.]|uniref:hypothetical protein n=1 Tax=Pedobacter sp. TaxID=1411316 RepID=UPI002C555C4A